MSLQMFLNDTQIKNPVHLFYVLSAKSECVWLNSLNTQIHLNIFFFSSQAFLYIIHNFWFNGLKLQIFCVGTTRYLYALLIIYLLTHTRFPSRSRLYDEEVTSPQNPALPFASCFAWRGSLPAVWTFL